MIQDYRNPIAFGGGISVYNCETAEQLWGGL